MIMPSILHHVLKDEGIQVVVASPRHNAIQDL